MPKNYRYLIPAIFINRIEGMSNLQAEGGVSIQKSLALKSRA
jgi:hypothetical protein